MEPGPAEGVLAAITGLAHYKLRQFLVQIPAEHWRHRGCLPTSVPPGRKFRRAEAGLEVHRTFLQPGTADLVGVVALKTPEACLYAKINETQ